MPLHVRTTKGSVRDGRCRIPATWRKAHRWVLPAAAAGRPLRRRGSHHPRAVQGWHGATGVCRW
eukprot:11523372-Alexandrium_andersonii.AAC.1